MPTCIQSLLNERRTSKAWCWRPNSIGGTARRTSPAWTRTGPRCRWWQLKWPLRPTWLQSQVKIVLKKTQRKNKHLSSNRARQTCPSYQRLPRWWTSGFETKAGTKWCSPKMKVSILDSRRSISTIKKTQKYLQCCWLQKMKNGREGKTTWSCSRFWRKIKGKNRLLNDGILQIAETTSINKRYPWWGQ